MRQTIELNKLLRQEFGCYYDPDLLELGWEKNLSEMASDSATRIGYQVKEENDLRNLIELLQEAHDNLKHPVIEMICDQTLIDWTDEPQDWHLLQKLLDMIIANLQKNSDLSLISSDTAM
jgi:hypothetical protein